jgi:hypothetical protein
MTEFPEIEWLGERSFPTLGKNVYVFRSDAEQAVRDAVERNERETVEARMESGRDEFVHRQAVRECVEALLREADVQRNCGEGDAADTYVAAASLLTMLGGEDAR